MEHIKRELELAHKAVADLPEPLQSQAFGKLVEKILEKEYGTHTRSTQTLPPHRNDDVTSQPIKIHSMHELARKIGADAAVLDDFLEVKNDDVHLLFPTKREFDMEEIIVFTVLYMAARSVCIGERDVDSGRLREAMSNKGVSLQNVSTNLKRFPSLIVHKSGKKGSTNTSYRLTTEGQQEGIAALKSIIAEGARVKEMQFDFLNSEKPGKRRGARSTGISNAINVMLDAGFFNEFKSTNQLVEELRKQAFFNKRQDIDSYLRKVLLGKRLLREKRNGVWEYVLKK